MLVSTHYPGSKASITSLRRKLKNHKQYTKEHNDDIVSADTIQPLDSSLPWADLFNRGYIRIEKEIAAVVPKKSTTIVSYSRRQETFCGYCSCLDNCRELVWTSFWTLESFFLETPLIGGEVWRPFLCVFVCAALANFQISFHLLRDHDIENLFSGERKAQAVAITTF